MRSAIFLGALAHITALTICHPTISSPCNDITQRSDSWQPCEAYTTSPKRNEAAAMKADIQLINSTVKKTGWDPASGQNITAEHLARLRPEVCTERALLSRCRMLTRSG